MTCSKRTARRSILESYGAEVFLTSAEDGMAGAVEHAERLAGVLATIDGLKPAVRRSFLLHRLHGCSYAEIARDAGVSVSMIEKHVMAAMLALRQHSA